MFLEYSSTDEAQSQWLSVLSGGDPSGLWIEPVVTPAKAGVHPFEQAWIPASAGMTDGTFLNRYFIREDG